MPLHNLNSNTCVLPKFCHHAFKGKTFSEALKIVVENKKGVSPFYAGDFTPTLGLYKFSNSLNFKEYFNEELKNLCVNKDIETLNKYINKNLLRFLGSFIEPEVKNIILNYLLENVDNIDQNLSLIKEVFEPYTEVLNKITKNVDNKDNSKCLIKAIKDFANNENDVSVEFSKTSSNALKEEIKLLNDVKNVKTVLKEGKISAQIHSK